MTTPRYTPNRKCATIPTLPRAGGVTIITTAEHPFWVVGKGWVDIHEVAAGDRLVGRDGAETVVEAVEPTTEYGKVYNFRVADHHTYFVGCDEWEFSLWTHNAKCIRVVGDEELANLAVAKGFTPRPGHRVPLRLTVPAEQKKLVKNLRETAAGKANYKHVITVTVDDKALAAFKKRYKIKPVEGHHPESMAIPQHLIGQFDNLIKTISVKTI